MAETVYERAARTMRAMTKPEQAAAAAFLDHLQDLREDERRAALVRLSEVTGKALGLASNGLPTAQAVDEARRG